MFKNFRDKVALSGIAILVIGVILLISTFITAYGFLTQTLSIIAGSDLVRTFGEALAPLITACIHIMYLGVMGWVGSLVTIRGVTLIVNAPKLEVPVTIPQKPVVSAVAQPQVQAKPVIQKVKNGQPEKETPKSPEQKAPEVKPQEPKPPEPKAPEPEIVVIPPDELMPQQPPQQPQKTNEKPQNGNSQPQSSTP